MKSVFWIIKLRYADLTLTTQSVCVGGGVGVTCLAWHSLLYPPSHHRPNTSSRLTHPNLRSAVSSNIIYFQNHDVWKAGSALAFGLKGHMYTVPRSVDQL
jgi:hypothetical protein